MTSGSTEGSLTFLGLAARNLARRPWRTALTLVALATAIAAVMALLSVATGFTDSLRAVYELHRVDVVVTRAGTADRLSSSLEAKFVDAVETVPGVQDAAGVLLETLSLEQQQIYGVPAMGLDFDAWLFADYRWVGSPPTTTRFPHPDDAADPPSVFLGENLAERSRLDVGQMVTVFDESFRVGGVFRSGSVFESGSMILSLPDLQRLSGRDAQITYINVRLDPSTDAAKVTDVVATIQSLDPKLLALPTDTFVESDTRMQLAEAMAWMTSGIALLIGAIGTLNTMMTSVLERTTEIGIFRAIGWSHRRVAGLILLESMGLAILATVIGGIAASLLLGGMSQAEAVRGMIHPTLRGSVLVRGSMIGVGIGLLGASLPMWRASRMRPTEALRHGG